jgi:hypothetical protein
VVVLGLEGELVVSEWAIPARKRWGIGEGFWVIIVRCILSSHNFNFIPILESYKWAFPRAQLWALTDEWDTHDRFPLLHRPQGWLQVHCSVGLGPKARVWVADAGEDEVER